MEQVYNLKYLISVSLHLQSPQIWYKLETWKTGWPWNRKTIHGVKSTICFGDTYNNVEDFLADNPKYIIDNNYIYQKPYVYMQFVDDNYNKIYFDTKEEARNYYNEISNKLENKI